MTLFIDIENKKLVQSKTSERSVSNPIFMQGDNEPIIINLLEHGVDTLFNSKVLNPETDFIRVAIARFTGYPKSLTYASGYTLNADGSAEVLLPLNTQNIEIALQDQASISAYLEVEYSNTNGSVITVLQTPCILKNDLIDNSPTLVVGAEYYDKTQTNALIDGVKAIPHRVYDEQGNLLNEKLEWRTVKVAENVYTQKWVKIA